jgi:GNAT superfamily N-acetyltransferase
MIVREFVPADQDAARSIIVEGLGEHFGFVDASLNPDLRDIADSYTRKGHVFLVAEVDGQLVGTACLVFENRACGRIVRLSVARAFRRRGIAGSLLRRIIECAGSRALSELVVATQPAWTDAVGFYRAAGFVPFDRDEVDVHMRLRLPAA